MADMGYDLSVLVAPHSGIVLLEGSTPKITVTPGYT